MFAALGFSEKRHPHESLTKLKAESVKIQVVLINLVGATGWEMGNKDQTFSSR